MSIKPESIFSTTLARLIYGALVLVGLGWGAKTQVNSILTEVRSLANEVALVKSGQDAQAGKIDAVNKKLDNQYVTWPIARLYASETRRANAALPLYLPDVDDYQKANRPN